MPNGGSSRSCLRSFIQGSSYSGPSRTLHYQTAHDDYDEDFNAVDCVPSYRCGGPTRLSNRQRQWQSSAAALSRYNESFLTDATGGTDFSEVSSMDRRRGEEQLSRRWERKLKSSFDHGRVVQGNRLSPQLDEDDRCSRTGGTCNSTFLDDFDEISFSHRSQVGLLVGRSSSLDEEDFDEQQYFLSSSFDGGLDDPCQEDGGNYGYHGSQEWSRSPAHELEAYSRGAKISTAFKSCVPSVMKKKKKMEKKKHVHSASFSVGSMPSIPEWPTQHNHVDIAKPAVEEDRNFAQGAFVNEHLEPGYLNEQGEEEKELPDIQPFSAYHKRNGPVALPFAKDKEVDSRNSYYTAKEFPPAYHTEAQLLDTLAHDLTLAQNYRTLQQSIQELTGKSHLERIMQQQQTLLYQMAQERSVDVPNVVGFGKSEDQSDLVSEVGMASTTGGRYNDNSSLMSALGKTHNTNHLEDYDDYGPLKTKSVGYGDMYPRRNAVQIQLERAAKEGSRNRSRRHMASSIESQNHDLRDRLEERSARSNLVSTADRQLKDLSRQRSQGLAEDTPVYGETFSYGNYGKSLIDESFRDEDEFSSPHDRNEVFVERLNTDTIDGMESFESVDDGPTIAQRDNARSLSPPKMKSDESPIDHMPSPTRLGLKIRPKKSEIFDRWREESRSTSDYSGISISSRRENLVADNISETSSSFSRFSRSSKYREVLGTPYKITKDDRGSSIGSTQTHKWSNTSTVRRNQSHSFMSTHNETTSSCESSASSVQNDPSEKYSRISPHSVAQYDTNDDP